MSTERVVIVSGPPGIDTQAALFAEAVDIRDTDILVTIERPGNVEVEIMDPEE